MSRSISSWLFDEFTDVCERIGIVRLAIVTGADHFYFDLMYEVIKTLDTSDNPLNYNICVLDFGLHPEQIALIEQHQALIKHPTWMFEASDHLKTQANLGYATRPVLPSYFPGFDMYLWLDADVSIRDHTFIPKMIEAASGGSLAIAEEVDRTYAYEPHAVKWQVGNAFRCFGLRQGLKLCLGRAINSGVFALEAEAPHWSAWQARYQQAVDRAQKVNLDQHALMAVLYLDRLPCHYLDNTYNWICTRSQPVWDEARQAFCRPYAPHDVIQVLHLAGRNKRQPRSIRTLAGEMEEMQLSYAKRLPQTLAA